MEYVLWDCLASQSFCLALHALVWFSREGAGQAEHPVVMPQSLWNARSRRCLMVLPSAIRLHRESSPCLRSSSSRHTERSRLKQSWFCICCWSCCCICCCCFCCICNCCTRTCLLWHWRLCCGSFVVCWLIVRKGCWVQAFVDPNFHVTFKGNLGTVSK